MVMITARTSRRHRICIAAVVIVAFVAGVGEGSRFPRPYSRGSRRRPSPPQFPASPFGTAEGSGRQRDALPSPPDFRDDGRRSDDGSTRHGLGGDDQGEWLKMWVIRKHQSDNRNNNRESLVPAAPATVVQHSIKKHVKSICMGPIKCKVLDVIDVRKKNETTSRNAQQQDSTQGPSPAEETFTTNQNQRETAPQTTNRPNRRAFTADPDKIPCGGQRVGRRIAEELCYRFNVSRLFADLGNDSVVSGALVLLPAGNGFGVSGAWTSPRRNISIVAKFPTSGEDAFTESISATNILFNLPSVWQSAVLERGPSLVDRAIQEDGVLVLKISVVTSSSRSTRPITSDYFPVKDDMLPVLIIDIEFNSTTSSQAGTGPTISATHENVVRRLRSKRSPEKRSSDSDGPNNLNSHPVIQDISCIDGCCHGSFSFPISELDQRIFYPRTVQTTVCFGSCQEDKNLALMYDPAPSTIHRDSPFEDVLRHVRNDIYDHGSSITPCAPSKRGPLPILFFDEDYDIIQTRLEGGLVTNCGCTWHPKT